MVAGGRGWDTTVDGVVAALPKDLEVLLPGYLPLELLAGFLGGADVVAYPSSAEGFGLPVLEAMACGAAVLTTRFLALPEVGGDAVEYTVPTPRGSRRRWGSCSPGPSGVRSSPRGARQGGDVHLGRVCRAAPAHLRPGGGLMPRRARPGPRGRAV